MPSGPYYTVQPHAFCRCSCNFFLFAFLFLFGQCKTPRKESFAAHCTGGVGGGVFVSSSITQPLPKRMVHPRTRNFMDSHTNTYTSRARGHRTRTWKRSSNFGTFRVVKSPENTRTEPSGCAFQWCSRTNHPVVHCGFGV